MQCSKSCHLRDLELDNLFDNEVIEQVYLEQLFSFLRALRERKTRKTLKNIRACVRGDYMNNKRDAKKSVMQIWVFFPQII